MNTEQDKLEGLALVVTQATDATDATWTVEHGELEVVGSLHQILTVLALVEEEEDRVWLAENIQLDNQGFETVASWHNLLGPDGFFGGWTA